MRQSIPANPQLTVQADVNRRHTLDSLTSIGPAQTSSDVDLILRTSSGLSVISERTERGSQLSMAESGTRQDSGLRLRRSSEPEVGPAGSHMPSVPSDPGPLPLDPEVYQR